VRTLLLMMAALSATATNLRAEDWPAWRGVRGDGASLETNIPVRWGPGDNIAWKTPIPGKGHASPVVAGGKVYVITCTEDDQTRRLLCLDRRDGRVLWQREVLKAPLEGKNRLNSHASSTPAADDKRVWVTFLAAPKVWVVCYDTQGKELWRVCPGEHYSKHGYCSTIIPYKDWIILNCDQDAPEGKRAYIVALDKATGAEKWRIDRPNRIRSYSPPYIVEAAGRTQMVLSGCKCVASYDPDTGRQYWIIDGPTEQFVASMVFHQGVFCITGGYPTLHVLGIKPDGQGNVTDTHVLWHIKKSATCHPSYVPSPVAAAGCFFIVSDFGYAQAMEAATGKMLWLERLSKHHSASPVLAEGRVYFTDDDGVTDVVKAGRTFERIARNELGEKCFASPAISDGQIIFRTDKSVICVGKK